MSFTGSKSDLIVHFGRSTGYRLHYRNIKCDLFESDGKQGTTDNIWSRPRNPGGKNGFWFEAIPMRQILIFFRKIKKLNWDHLAFLSWLMIYDSWAGMILHDACYIRPIIHKIWIIDSRSENKWKYKLKWTKRVGMILPVWFIESRTGRATHFWYTTVKSHFGYATVKIAIFGTRLLHNYYYITYQIFKDVRMTHHFRYDSPSHESMTHYNEAPSCGHPRIGIDNMCITAILYIQAAVIYIIILNDVMCMSHILNWQPCILVFQIMWFRIIDDSLKIVVGMTHELKEIRAVRWRHSNMGLSHDRINSGTPPYYSGRYE